MSLPLARLGCCHSARRATWHLAIAILFFTAKTALSADGPIVPGDIAILKDGIASAPANAPQAVKEAIWAVNQIRDKPYVWGGGHGAFDDRGYDCSGTVSYLLHHAGHLSSPTPSRGLLQFGAAGCGQWITIYARKGHAFAVVAGLRLDTTGTREREGPRWRSAPRAPDGFTARHPPGL